MRRGGLRIFGTGLLLAAASSVAVLGELSQPAVAKTCYETITEGGAQLEIIVPCKGEGGGGSAGGDTDGGSGGGGPQKCSSPTGECTRGNYHWFNPPGCFASHLSPPPPAAHPAWGGHTPDEGSIWACQAADAGQGSFVEEGGMLFFVPRGQAPVVLVDGAAIAESALGRMPLARPQVHTAPTPPAMTYVGLETWLWMQPDAFRTLTLTVGAGGASVTVTAEPVRAWWDMGDGRGATCGSAGREWVVGMTDADKTDCLYVYTKVSDFEPNGVFAINTTLVYQVDWTCTGPCQSASGSLGEVDGPSSTGQLRVGERQSVIVGRGEES